MHKQPKPPPLIRTDISPQEALAEFLDRCGYDGSEYVPQLFATHAHELAERQRAKLIEEGYGPCVCGGCSWCLAQDYIDYIDPKARGRV